MRAKAGNLDRVIELQTATVTRNAAGEVVNTWARFLRCFANVYSENASEAFGADRQLGAKTKRFTIRHVANVNSKLRILYDEEYYDIISLNNLEGEGRRRFIQITATLIEGHSHATA